MPTRLMKRQTGDDGRLAFGFFCPPLIKALRVLIASKTLALGALIQKSWKMSGMGRLLTLEGCARRGKIQEELKLQTKIGAATKRKSKPAPLQTKGCGTAIWA